MTPEVLADPVGVVVGLVARIEPQLGQVVIEGTVTSVAGGRAKRRKLAQALAERPSVLTDGQSPAPRAVGELLIALRKAGARAVSPPACTGCGKDLRTMQRRGQDWYCSVCGPVRLPCAVCGKTRRVASRDRDEQPRCAQCPPGGGQDPAEIVMNVVAAIDPALPAALVSAAMTAAAAGAGQRRPLAWALQDQPGLLTGAGAWAPVPSVLRLISELCDAGATRIVRPPCPGCGRVIGLHRRIGGQWSCRNCVARSRFQLCARCGAVQQVAIRDEHGRPLCPHCLVTDPANQEICTGCRAPPGQRPLRGRAFVPGLRAGHDDDLLDLRPPRAVLCVQDDWRAVVRSMQAALGPVQPLRPGRPGSRRHQGRTSLRGLHPS